MKRQLVLLDDTPGSRDGVWRLDEHTRAVGRQGIAQAREALRRAERPPAETSADAHRTAA